MFSKLFTVVFVIAVVLTAPVVFAAEVGDIQDNSFLVEEAYNQEPGVVQHIQSFRWNKDGSWIYSFTQEWPVFGQTHQFSYTIPVARQKGDGQLQLFSTDPSVDQSTQPAASPLTPNTGGTGLGDVALNYRYQAVLQDNIAFAPRFSLLLPTGDWKRGLGTGTVGFQVNLPLSFKLSDKLVTHYNLGMTFTPNSKSPAGAQADTLSTNYGASLIYLATKNINLMLEAAGSSDQAVEGPGKTSIKNSFFINPGVRCALNFKMGDDKILQIVPGISFPIGVGPSNGEYGVFGYLSFEHSLF